MKNLGILDTQASLGIMAPAALALPCGNPAIPADSLIIYVAQGSKVGVELARGAIGLGPGDVCLLAPNLRHSLDGRGSVTALAIERAMLLNAFAPLVSFCPLLLDFFLRCREDPAGIPFLRFSHREGERVGALIERVDREFAEKRKSYQSAVINALAEFFVLLTRYYNASEASDRLPASGRADLILGFLGEHYATSTLESTARHFHCHPNTIATILKEEVGENFSALRRELRLERARVLLAQTALPVSEIAALCGYENMTSFYKVFKEKFGTTPRLFAEMEGRGSVLRPA